MAIDSKAPPIRARILVVDDNPGTATTLARAIVRSSPDLEVISATDGDSALQHVKDDPIDLVITDMMMPNINGLELIESLRQRAEGNPIYTILMTAYDVPGLKESARRMKVDETLIKPVPPERICQIVRKALEKMQPSQAAKPASETGQKFKLLVADDNPSNLALLARYLQQEEYELITAVNGLETLEKARAEMPDLLLLDVNMPEKDGFQVLEEIRSDPATEHLPVIIVTAARQDPVDMQYALNLGADDYVIKPFDRRELMARIRTRLRVKDAEDVIRRRNRELNLLPEIGRELSARLDVADLADVILRRTTETLGALMGHLVLLSPQGVFHQMRHVAPGKQDAPKTELPDLSLLLKQLNETRQGFVIGDTRNDARWPAAAGDSSRSMVIVPIFGRFELLGLLALAHEQPDYFSQEHMLLLQAIASQAAIAVENAQLYAGTAQQLPGSLSNPVQAVLVFDKEARLVSINPPAGDLFAQQPLAPGQPLPTGAGYEALATLLQEACLAGTLKAGEITWPDGRTKMASVAPIQAGGCVLLLSGPSHQRGWQMDNAKNKPRAGQQASQTHSVTIPGSNVQF